MAVLLYLEGPQGEKFIGEQRVQLFEDIAFINLAYFCPQCGQIWARSIYGPAYLPNAQQPRWSAVNQYCPLHGDGTLLNPYSLDGCDEALIKREFELLMLNPQPLRWIPQANLR